MSGWSRIVLVSLLMLLTGCPRPLAMTGRATQEQGLSGQLQWSERYAIQADPVLSEIGNGATVSLIDPAKGMTIATSLSAPAGTFSLNFGAWSPTLGKVYMVEAIKGLKLGGEPNRAGAPASRLRTFVVKQSDGWKSLTAGSLVINRSTTALAVISGLKGLDAAQNLALIGSLTAGTPDVFSASGAAGILGAEYASVWGLVDTALSLYQDPVRSITLDAATHQFARLERAPFVTDMAPRAADPGDTLTLFGNGFDPISANNKVYFNGVQVPPGNVSVDATGTRLTVIVPDNAQTGVVTVQVGNLVTLVAGGSVFRVGGGNVAIVVGSNVFPDGASASGNGYPNPTAIAMAPDGSAYFSGVYQVFRLAPDGSVSLVAGPSNWLTSTGYGGDGGPARGAGFGGIDVLACDGAGNLYIADVAAHRIRMVPKATGTYFGKTIQAGNIDTIVGNGTTAGLLGDGGPAATATLKGLFCFTADAAGNLYISDNNANRIRMVAKATGAYFGKTIQAGNIDTIAGTGTWNFTGDGGSAASATFRGPYAIALDASGSLYISDSGSYRIRMVAKETGTYFGRTIQAGNIDTLVGVATPGTNGDSGPARSAQLGQPYGLTLDASGNLYIPTVLQQRIRMVAKETGTYFGKTIAAGNIDTISGDGTQGFGGDGGPATGARLNYPWAIAVDGSDNLLFMDTLNFRVRLIAKSGGTYFGKTVQAGNIDTIAGNGTLGLGGDGGPASKARMLEPFDSIVDSAGNLYFNDVQNNCIRMVPKVTGTYFGKTIQAGNIDSIVGNGTMGSTGDGGPASQALLFMPAGLAMDALGNLYIADLGNHRIRVVARVTGTYFGKTIQAGNIDTIAGAGGSSHGGDGGPAASAGMSSPWGLAFDGAGNLYISDNSSNRIRVVAKATDTFFGKTIQAGNIDTIVGTGAQNFSGDGGSASLAALFSPMGITLDGTGNLYVADGNNHRVRMVAKATGAYFGKTIQAGNIDTIAGNGTPDFAGDGGPASQAALNLPAGMALGANGELYVADAMNNRVRMVPSTSGTYFGLPMTAGNLYTIVGDGTMTGNLGDSPLTTSLPVPVHPFEDAQGALYIASAYGNYILKVY